MGPGLLPMVGTGFLPEIDEGAFVLDYFTPGGTALAETNRQVGVAEGILAGTPEITGTSRRTGAELGMFATAQNSGDIVVRLAPPGRRSRDVFDVIDDVRGRIEAAVPRLHIEFMQILADVINDLAGAARPVEVKLYGERLDTLEAYARRLAPELERIRGLEDLYNGVSEPTAELWMRVNEAEAYRIGMTRSTLAVRSARPWSACRPARSAPRTGRSRCASGRPPRSGSTPSGCGLFPCSAAAPGASRRWAAWPRSSPPTPASASSGRTSNR